MEPEGLEGVGEVVTGGLVARAVEPKAGEGKSGAGEGAGRAGEGSAEACLNCGTKLIGPHCHVCGQAGTIHRSLSAWWHDLAHGVLHLDGKAWRTLPLLAWRPGDLTRRYVEGERARFVSPLALFLFSVFLMFAVFSMLGANLLGVGDQAGRDFGAAMAKQGREIALLEARRRQAQVMGQSVTLLDASIAEASGKREALAAGGKFLIDDGPVIQTDFKTGWQRLDVGIDRANKNPSLLFYKIQTNAYKFSWALIPISLPFLWLLFIHRRRYRQYKAYDHIIFVTYSIAFMSLWLIALVLLSAASLGNALIALGAIMVPPVHIYRQLKGAYRLERFSALWRTFALLFFAAIAIGLFSTLLLALGVLG